MFWELYVTLQMEFLRPTPGCVDSTDIAPHNPGWLVMINEIVSTRQAYSMHATRHTLRLSVDFMDRP